MKNTILTEKDAKLIEQTILNYGRIVTVEDLLIVFNHEYSQSAAHNRIQILTKAGWLKRIKRGLYLVIENLSARFQNDRSLLLISNTLNQNSYVSLGYALKYYQMLDQYSNIVIAITTTDSKRYKFDDFIFKFAKVKQAMYFGFSQKMESGKFINIADAEKALIDYLYLDNSFSSASIVFEKIRDHRMNFDFHKLLDYAQRSDITIKRKIGFLLDQIDVDTRNLYLGLEKNKGFSRFTTDSTMFNGKWRIYYDARIIG